MNVEQTEFAKENAILYKTTDDEIGWNLRWLKANETDCKEVCKNENYAETYYLYLEKAFLASDIHLRTDIICFENKYYFPNEKIPYPKTETKYISKFQVNMVWDKDNANDEQAYDEVYKHEGINWGFGYLWTDITTKFIFPDKITEVHIVAQEIVKYFPEFIKNLEENNSAIYHSQEYSPFKWLCWTKGDKIRLIHQNYNDNEVINEFDILINKCWFLHCCHNILNNMQKYSDADEELYKKYVHNKYRK